MLQQSREPDRLRVTERSPLRSDMPGDGGSTELKESPRHTGGCRSAHGLLSGRFPCSGQGCGLSFRSALSLRNPARIVKPGGVGG